MVRAHIRLRAHYRPRSSTSLYEACLGQTPILRYCVVCARVKNVGPTWFAVGLRGMFGNCILKYDSDMKIQNDLIESDCDSLISNILEC